MNGELIVVDDLPGAFADRVIGAFQQRPEELFCLALSGGSTARPCYERLAADSEGRVDWLSVNVYWGDERCVPPDSEESNQLLGRQALLERVGAANAVYPMSCEEGPDSYALRLGEVGKLDFIHLGMGPDGHTASLFPNSPALDADPGQLVARNEDPSGRNKHPRMTLTYAGLARARLVVFTVAGESKREALQAVIDGADLPAARVQADQIVWLVDRDAAPR
ncbi:6-phosphogluconolactonase [Acidiferrimicrobium sp. IK]|uniref:6-phosphogluconolactonase n=1 Tax=Acidiferrimicrobium sp. IK TaxID=2871700 RepID=UPI0021CB02CB|nr:6-phosphogluconolactonase [Acidiferrimicrobium sp. IK]MCU4184642.1 6-phosphogluconolactonase [Acidiferrimicrobium sp. IK]